MMKFVKAMALLVIAILLSVSVIAPSAEADTKTYDETKYLHEGVYSDTITFGPKCTYQPTSKYAVLELYTLDEYGKWMRDGTGVPFKTVGYNEMISEEGGTFGVVSDESQIIAVGTDTVVMKTLTRCDLVYYSFTGIRDSTSSIHFDFGTHSGGIKILVVKSLAAGSVKSTGVEKQYSNPDIVKSVIAKGEFEAGVNSADISFKCDTTDVYWAFVSYEPEQKVTCQMTVNGAATFVDSAALSVIMIVIALGLIAWLLYISNRKLIQ